jgi:hypothetical protein
MTMLRRQFCGAPGTVKRYDDDAIRYVAAGT